MELSQKTWKGRVISIHRENCNHGIYYTHGIQALGLLNNKSIQIPSTDGLVKADRLFFANCCLGDSLPLYTAELNAAVEGI